jgi:hypothetical protein
MIAESLEALSAQEQAIVDGKRYCMEPRPTGLSGSLLPQRELKRV